MSIDINDQASNAGTGTADSSSASSSSNDSTRQSTGDNSSSTALASYEGKVTGSNWKEKALEYSRNREAHSRQNKQTTVVSEDGDEAAVASQRAESPSVTSPDGEPSSSQLEPRAPRRIQELLKAQKKERQAHRETITELEKHKLAVNLLQEEVSRLQKIAASANLIDPTKEELVKMKLEHQVELFNRDLPSKMEQRWQEEEEAEQRRTVGETSANMIRQSIQSTGGLVSEAEVISFMKKQKAEGKQTSINDVVSLINTVAEKRRAVAAQTARAPRSAGTNNNAGRDNPAPFKYQGQSSILKFLEDEETSRQGK